jgi:hypothetical protein
MRQSLDRDIAAKLAIVRPINLAHATGAQRSHDLIRTDLAAE